MVAVAVKWKREQQETPVLRLRLPDSSVTCWGSKAEQQSIKGSL